MTEKEKKDGVGRLWGGLIINRSLNLALNEKAANVPDFATLVLVGMPISMLVKFLSKLYAAVPVERFQSGRRQSVCTVYVEKKGNPSAYT